MTMQENQLPTELPAETKGEVAESEAQQEPDWKAKYEATEAARAKLDNDLKAIRGARFSADDRQNQILDRMDMFEKQQVALIKAFASGDTEGLPTEVARVQAEGYGVRERRRFEGQYQSLLEDFHAVVQDAELDVTTAPELKEARDTWSKTYAAMDRGELSVADGLTQFAKAIAQASQATKTYLRRLHQDEAKKIREETKAATKKALDDAGVLDMDTGPTSGGGGQMSWARAQKIKKVSDLSDEAYEKLIA